MQKISSYLYPNRVQLLADLAGFSTEYTNVYQRTVKIYKGIDNTIEFDIKNADQKRIELVTSPVITDIKLNVMDASGHALRNSPYTVTPHSTLKGIATVKIPHYDLDSLQAQFLSYSVTATKAGDDVILYGDSLFGAAGQIELLGNAMPTVKAARIYTDFSAEINLEGLPISKSSAIPTTFYEAEKTTSLNFEIDYTDFKGIIWIEGTKQSTITTEAFKPEVRLHEFPELTSATSGIFTITMDVDGYKYFRIRYLNSRLEDVTGTNLSGTTGKVDKVTVS